MDWQPIETAPRDGTYIYGLQKDGSYYKVFYEDGAWIWDSSGELLKLDMHPTHWMPLPNPPEDQ